MLGRWEVVVCFVFCRERTKAAKNPFIEGQRVGKIEENDLKRGIWPLCQSSEQPNHERRRVRRHEVEHDHSAAAQARENQRKHVMEEKVGHGPLLVVRAVVIFWGIAKRFLCERQNLLNINHADRMAVCQCRFPRCWTSKD